MGMGLMSDFLKGQYKSEQRGLYCPFVFYTKVRSARMRGSG